MSDRDPQIGVLVQNDSGLDIPPRSVVVIDWVEITPTYEMNESIAIHHIVRYTGQAGNLLVTSNSILKAGQTSSSSSIQAPPSTASASDSSTGIGWWNPANSYGRAFADQRICVALDPTVAPPLPGEEWGPTPNQWYITRGGVGFQSDGYPTGDDGSASSSTIWIPSGSSSYSSSGFTFPYGQFDVFFRGATASGSGGGGGGGGAGAYGGCPNCFVCPGTPTIFSCDAAPSGAYLQYFIQSIDWADPYSVFAPDGTITIWYAVASDCGSSASVGSSASSSGSGCIWYSCPIIICQTPSSSSSSGSSSSSSTCGTYQWQMEIVTITDAFGNSVPAMQMVPFFLSGTDWLPDGFSETLS